MDNHITISKKVIICVIFFILAVFCSGYRWDVGIDWMSYYNLFGGKILSNPALSENIELVNLLIFALLRSNNYDDGRFWIFIMAIINCYFTAASIYKYSNHPLYSIFLYVLLGYFFESLNMIRQACSISIFLFGWRFIGKSLIRFILIISIASIFHSSSIILFPIYFINKINLKKKHLKQFIIIAVLIAPFSTYLAPKLIFALPMYEKYQDSSVIKYATGSGNILSYIRMVFPLMLMYLSYLKWDILSKKANITIAKLTFLGLLLCIAFPTTLLIIRTSFYFTIGLIFYIPCLFRLFTFTNKLILWGLTLIYYSLSLAINYLYVPTAKIIPYTLRFDLDFHKVIILFIITLLSLSTIHLITTYKTR